MQLITGRSAISSPGMERSLAVRNGDSSAAAQTPPAAMKPRRKGLHEGRGGRRETSQAPEGPAERQKGYSGISLHIKTSTQPPNELEGVAVMTPRVDGTMRSRGPTQASSPRPAFDGEATSIPEGAACWAVSKTPRKSESVCCHLED